MSIRITTAAIELLKHIPPSFFVDVLERLNSLLGITAKDIFKFLVTLISFRLKVSFHADLKAMRRV